MEALTHTVIQRRGVLLVCRSHNSFGVAIPVRTCAQTQVLRRRARLCSCGRQPCHVSHVVGGRAWVNSFSCPFPWQSCDPTRTMFRMCTTQQTLAHSTQTTHGDGGRWVSPAPQWPWVSPVPRVTEDEALQPKVNQCIKLYIFI